MPVYVDKETNLYRGMKMCHMLADTLEELHTMADQIGLRRGWFQVSRSGIPHYDICKRKKALALKFGAVEIDRTKVVELMGKLRAASSIVKQ